MKECPYCDQPAFEPLRGEYRRLKARHSTLLAALDAFFAHIDARFIETVKARTFAYADIASVEALQTLIRAVKADKEKEAKP